MRKELMRLIPGIDEILGSPVLLKEAGDLPHRILADAARRVSQNLRCGIREGTLSEDDLFFDKIVNMVIDEARKRGALSMIKLINASGIPLHTNLGRAPLPKAAIDNLCDAVDGYSNLEYDISSGRRGSRHAHLLETGKEILGVEDIMVVNNNAAALMLCLSALAPKGEVIVSRGEMIEIGGNFRIPEIMEQSGSILREVGTTNKTRLDDYERALGEETDLVLKVHTSNYKIVGFSEDVPMKDLADLAHEHGLPAVYDLGSGLLCDLSLYGIDEPTVFSGLEAGADLVLFSGDKLFGGPQAGIIAGKHEYIEKMKKHPLARVLRVGKMTIAALEATMNIYYDSEEALKNIPVLHMLTAGEEELKGLAERMAEEIEKIPSVDCRIIETENQAGGGSAPGIDLPGYALGLRFKDISVQDAEEYLRSREIPIIARIHHNELLIETRTLMGNEYLYIIEALRSLVSAGKKL
jgi:L-seryl-tRNA(Ser) seleniumtransferase